MRTFDIPFSFVSSPETEKERLLYACENVASGFYQRHGFLTSPQVIKGYEEWTIVIPDVLQCVDSKFWQDSYKYGVNMSKTITQHMYRQTQGINLVPSSDILIATFEKDWQKHNNSFWQELVNVFPKEIKWIGSVEVRITKIGSLSSHYLLRREKGEKLVINLREDAPVHEIANLIILSLIFPLSEELGLTFTKRQALRNFVMSRPPFRKLFPKFKPKLYDAPKIPTRLKHNSDEYIKHLGIPNVIDPIKEISKNISIFGAKENKLLNELIGSKGEILTYDFIADLIWGEGKFKSYWAINKLVQRIEKKINSLNINLKIKRIRGVGYFI